MDLGLTLLELTGLIVDLFIICMLFCIDREEVGTNLSRTGEAEGRSQSKRGEVGQRFASVWSLVAPC